MNFLKAIPIVGSLFGGDDNNNDDGGAAAAQAHEREMQNARLDHQRMQQEQNRQHELALERERGKQQERQAEIAKVASAQAAAQKLEMQKQKDETTKYTIKLANEEKQKQRDHIEAESARKKAHEVHLQKLEQEKIRIKEAGEREKEKHKKAMKEMWINAKEKDRKNKEKQRDDALKRIKQVIDDLDKENKMANEQLIIIKKEHEDLVQNIENQDRIIKNWPNYKKDKLETKKRNMDKAFKDWQLNEKEIYAAIESTGVHEDNVCRFLKLTHSLIGETAQSQVHANRLDARLNTFYILLQRQCQDKLTIESVFESNRLQRFAPILAKENYHECDDLICDDIDEFNEDILSICKTAISQQINEWQKRHPHDIDPFEAFLTHYGIIKFKIGLEENGFDSLDAVNDIENDDDINGLIECAKIPGLFRKKLKRAINDLKNDNYKPPQSGNNSQDKQPNMDLKQINDNKDDDDDGDDKEEDIKPRNISKQEEKKLRKLCLKPETWQREQEKKILYTKLALLEQTPILGRFFNKMHDAIEQSSKLLAINDQLNDEQSKAVAVLMDNVERKAIEAPKDDDDDDNKDNEDPKNLPDFTQRKGWKQGTQVQIYSKENNKWFNGDIIKIFNDNDEEWLEIKYNTGRDNRTKQVGRYSKDIRDPISTECRAIECAIMVDINVVDIMRNEFELNTKTRDCLAVARGVERSAKAIMLCQSQMRQSMRLAGSILKLKPSNMTEKASELWSAVDKGIIHIIGASIEMSKISEEYFGFFLQFNQSLQRFISMNESDKEMSLMVSLEYLKKDIRDFGKFKNNFNKKLKKLSKECMDVITKCVEQQKGIETFNKAKIERERSKQIYLQEKEKYDTASDEFDAKLESKCNKRARDRAEAAKLSLQWKTLDDAIKANNKYKQQYTDRKLQLNEMNFDAFGANNKDPMPAQQQQNKQQTKDKQQSKQKPNDDDKKVPK